MADFNIGRAWTRPVWETGRVRSWRPSGPERVDWERPPGKAFLMPIANIPQSAVRQSHQMFDARDRGPDCSPRPTNLLRASNGYGTADSGRCIGQQIRVHL